MRDPASASRPRDRLAETVVYWPLVGSLRPPASTEDEQPHSGDEENRTAAGDTHDVGAGRRQVRRHRRDGALGAAVGDWVGDGPAVGLPSGSGSESGSPSGWWWG